MGTYTQALLSESPLYVQPGTYDARQDRRPLSDAILSPGVKDRGSFRVTWVSGMTIRIAAGTAYVEGGNVTEQGYYRLYKTGNNDLAVGAADPTNPRIDQVVLRQMDAAHDTSTLTESRIEIVPGTPTAGATLDNRNGALALTSLAENSQSYILLADVLVPAGASTLAAANIRDRRTRYNPWDGSNLITDVDIVPVLPHPVHTITNNTAYLPTSNNQAAYLGLVPRTITNATRIRWGYTQGAPTAVTGNYIIALYDFSGRLIISTASVAFTGASSSTQTRSETITATTFKAGMYWVLFGVASIAGSSLTIRSGINMFTAPPPIPGIGVGLTTGGVTAPSALNGFTEGSVTSPGLVCPSIALSVG